MDVVGDGHRTPEAPKEGVSEGAGSRGKNFLADLSLVFGKPETTPRKGATNLGFECPRDRNSVGKPESPPEPV